MRALSRVGASVVLATTTRDGDGLSVEPDETTTLEDAERHLQTSYPGLAGTATEEPLVFLLADGGC